MIEIPPVEISQPALEQIVQESCVSFRHTLQGFVHSEYERFRRDYFTLQSQGEYVDYLTMLREQRSRTRRVLDSLLQSAEGGKRTIILQQRRALSLYFRDTTQKLEQEARQAQETPVSGLPLAATVVGAGLYRRRQKEERIHLQNTPQYPLAFTLTPALDDLTKDVKSARILNCVIGQGLKRGYDLETISDGGHDFFSLPEMRRHDDLSWHFLREQVDGNNFSWVIRNLVLHDIGTCAYPDKTDTQILAIPQKDILNNGLSKYMHQCNPDLETAIAGYWERFNVPATFNEEPTLVTKQTKPVYEKKRLFSRLATSIAAAVVVIGVSVGAYLGFNSTPQMPVQERVSVVQVQEVPVAPINKQPILHSPAAIKKTAIPQEATQRTNVYAQPITQEYTQSRIQWSPQQAPENVNEQWYQFKTAVQTKAAFSYTLGDALMQDNYVVRIRVDNGQGKIRTVYRPVASQDKVRVSGTVIDAGVGMKTDKGFVYLSSVSQKDIVRK